MGTDSERTAVVAKTKVPAIEGWFTTDGEPALLGTRCSTCGTYFFPKETFFCRNPHCGGTELEEVRLSRRGTVWSYTVNHYDAPPPSVAKPPYAIAAVELAEERMVILGAVAGDASGLAVGSEVELIVDTLYEDDEHEYLVWKWRPAQ